MSKFLVFNLQLLPLDSSKTGEVGPDGYIRLFEELNKTVVKGFKEKSLTTNGIRLVNDTYFAPLHTKIVSEKKLSKNSKVEGGNGKFVYGQFVKFHKTTTVEDLYTKEHLFEEAAGQSAVSNRHELFYIFNPESHLIAIENTKNRLPVTKTMINALHKFLGPVASMHFSNYTLTVNLVSRGDDLNAILERAIGYSNIKINLTFKNGPTQDEVLDDFSEKNLHKLTLTASAARGATMSKVPDTIKGILLNAPTYGSASMSFTEDIDGKRVRSNFDTNDSPEVITARATGNEDSEGFYRRINKKIIELARRIGHS